MSCKGRELNELRQRGVTSLSLLSSRPLLGVPPGPSVTVSVFSSVDSACAVSMRTDTWSAFAEALRTPVEATTPKGQLPLWSPATFDGSRALQNVVSVCMLCMDIDVDPIPDREALERALAPYLALAHTSSSSTADAPRWRGVLALSRPVTATEYQHIARVVRDRLPFKVGTSITDAARQWYVPRRGTDGSYQIFATSGEPLDVDALLTENPYEPAVDVMQAVHAIDETHPEFNERLEWFIKVCETCTPPRNGGETFTIAQKGTRSAELPMDIVAAAMLDTLRPRCTPVLPIDKWPLVERLVARSATAGTFALGTAQEEIEAAKFLESLSLGSATAGVAPKLLPTGDDIDKAFDALLLSSRLATARGRVLEVPDSFDWNAPIEAVKYLVWGLIPLETVGMFVAPGSSVKTWTALDIARCVAKGEDWLGKYATKQGRVLVVDFESGVSELRRRVKLLDQSDGINPTSIIPIAYPNERLDDVEFWKALARRIRLTPFDVVIVDSLSEGATGVDENAPEASLPLKCAGRLTELVSTTVIIIHHARKDDGDNRKMVRGH